MTTPRRGARRLSTGWRQLAVGAAGALSLALALTATPAIAHDGDHDEPEVAATTADGCSAEERKELAALGDNFVAACDLAGNDFSMLRTPERALKPGETDSTDNLSLVANIPKQGAFADVSAFNSDLAFKGKYAFAGNYNGFMVYDITRAKHPRIVTQVVCPGSQNDISVYGDLLVLSVDSSRSDDSCNSTPLTAQDQAAWEGVRVFDISDPEAPEYVAAVETACGSHTHTLAPDKRGRNLYVYVSSYSPNAAFPDCQPPHDKISIVKVPVKNAAASSLVNAPVLFPDGGNTGEGYSATTSGCHDITAYPSKDIAAGACMGDGILLDIADRENPKVIEQVRDEENFAFWHSATFNNTATKVVFTDELGGGGAPTCNPETGRTKGANAIYDIVGGKKPGEARQARQEGQEGRQGHPAAGVPQLLQDPASAGRDGELRGPQRLADPGQGQGHHGPGLVPGRDLGLRLHQLPQAQGDRLVRPGPGLGHRAGPRRIVVGVLVQRPHLQQRHPEGIRRPRAR